MSPQDTPRFAPLHRRLEVLPERFTVVEVTADRRSLQAALSDLDLYLDLGMVERVYDLTPAEEARGLPVYAKAGAVALDPVERLDVSPYNLGRIYNWCGRPVEAGPYPPRSGAGEDFAEGYRDEAEAPEYVEAEVLA